MSAGLQDVLGITQWRKEHPKATWAEIEAAVDERMNQLRAQMLQDVVQMGETEEWSQKPEEERPRCVTCGKPLLARGEQTRFTSRLRAIERQFEKFGMAHERAYEAPQALRRLE